MAGRVTTAEPNRRGKLGAGKGLLGWIKLCRKYKQENNASSQTVITFEELRKHDTENDCWTAFRGIAICDIRSYVFERSAVSWHMNVSRAKWLRNIDAVVNMHATRIWSCMLKLEEILAVACNWMAYIYSYDYFKSSSSTYKIYAKTIR